MLELLTAMFKENTGRDLCDSGGIYGRNWQRNQDRDSSKNPPVDRQDHRKRTLDDLRELYPPEVVEAVDLLTHDKKALTYQEYIDRICESGNRRAIFVKLADQEDNLDPMRMLRLNPYVLRALQKRYRGVKPKLMAAAIALNPLED